MKTEERAKKQTVNSTWFLGHGYMRTGRGDKHGKKHNKKNSCWRYKTKFKWGGCKVLGIIVLQER